MKINSLGEFRYSITGLANDSYSPFFPSTQASLTVTMSATYEQLIQSHHNRLQDTTAAHGEQIFRNHMTALRGFLQSMGKTESSPIGVEMTSEHASSVKQCLASLTVSERSKSDRRSHLNAWRLTFELMGAGPDTAVRGRERRLASTVPSVVSPFESGLKAALRNAGLTPKRAALEAGISTSAIGRWTRGALPNLRSSVSLEKLEATLKLPVGHLVDLFGKSKSACEPVHRNEFREQASARIASKYFLRPDELSDEFMQSWLAMMQYKCSVRTHGKRRRSKARWSVTSGEDCPQAIPGLTTYNGNFYGSASLLWNQVASFLGFLKLPVENGGWGIPTSDVQSLAWLVVPEALDAYLEFMTSRSGGLKHTGHSAFCTNIASLTSKAVGYLTQSPELVGELPCRVLDGRSWDDLCEAARDVAADWKSACTDISRDPMKPIQFLLEQPNPMAPVFSAMQRLRTIGNVAPSGSKSEAIARRNELLIGLVLSNPLRRKNLIELTLRQDNSGNVYKTTTGEWRLRLPKASFKTGKRKSNTPNVYDVRVASWLHPLLNDYEKHFRPVLATDESPDNLFLTREGKPLHRLTTCLLRLTREHIPGSGGFGPHAFRHLVATHWLRENPDSFLMVAELLNDSIEVVMSTYAHLRKDDALTRHSNQLAEMLPNYLRASHELPRH